MQREQSTVSRLVHVWMSGFFPTLKYEQSIYWMWEEANAEKLFIKKSIIVLHSLSGNARWERKRGLLADQPLTCVASI